MHETGYSALAMTIAIGLAAAGCKKKDDEQAPGKPPAPAGDKAGTDPGASGKPTDKPPDKPAALTADTIDLARPVPVAALSAAILAWKGKRVTVGGHPWLGSGTDGALEALRAEPMKEGEYGDSKDKLATLAWKEGAKPADDQKVKLGDPVVVTCEIERGNTLWQNQLSLEECELVSTDKPFAADTPADPASLDAARPIPVQTLHKTFWAWMDKEVAVIGHYHSHTSSGTGDIRVDLADPQTSEKYVGCHVAAAPPDTIANDRDGVTATGKIDKENFDFYGSQEIQLIDCKLTNR